MGPHELFLYAFLIFFALNFCIERGLAVLNSRYVAARRGIIPDALKGVVSAETYERSIDYALARARFGHVSAVYSAALTLGYLLTPVAPFISTLSDASATLFENELWQGVALLLFFSMINGLMHLPFSLYGTFVLEERFGFNKTTFKTYVADRIKGLVLSLVLGIPFLYALMALVTRSGPLWWLWSALFVIGFQFLLMILFPLVIAPLFNKFTPLQDGDLKRELEALAQKCGFAAQGIYVMDGSRRSAHSNALFMGLGKARRIAIFDTLMAQLTPEELTAVLAHEIGHYKKRHILKTLILSCAMTLAGFYVMGVLLDWVPMYQAFRIGTPVAAKGLLVFLLIVPVFTFWVEPLMSWLSRKHEYEADAYAREQTGTPEPLASALLKLFEKNLSTLTPHPAFSAWHYSHPTLLERLRALRDS
jgi:STE24 endopeptidase